MMIMARHPPHSITNLVAAMEKHDHERFYQELAGLTAMSWGMGPDELTVMIAGLAPSVPGLAGGYAKVAVFLSACVEYGGSALPLAGVLPARGAQAMEDFARFPAAWDQASGGQMLPPFEPAGPESHWDPQPVMAAVSGRLVGAAESIDLAVDVAARLAASWFDVDDWLRLLISAMQRQDFRAAMTDRDRVRGASAAVRDDLNRARLVHGLSFVLDDEPLIVLDRASGRGYRLTMCGIGDNYQLHTLLADRLIGTGPGMLAGDRPRAEWVVAATDGPPRLPVSNPAWQRFWLFDGHGRYVYPEGRPADIEPFDGVRVLVVEPSRGGYGWSDGRAFPQMRPTLTLTGPLDAREAHDLLDRVAPPHEEREAGTSQR
jgi:hypothetical protein